MKPAVKLSFFYSLLSIFIGPAIVFLAPRHPSGLDCSDPVWDPAIPIAAREAIYANQAQFMIIPANIMIVIGISILLYLIYSGSKNNQFKIALFWAGPIVFMLAGYELIVQVMSSPFC